MWSVYLHRPHADKGPMLCLMLFFYRLEILWPWVKWRLMEQQSWHVSLGDTLSDAPLTWLWSSSSQHLLVQACGHGGKQECRAVGMAHKHMPRGILGHHGDSQARIWNQTGVALATAAEKVPAAMAMGGRMGPAWVFGPGLWG